MRSGVYEIVSTSTGKRYIGSAVNLANRWSHHKSKLAKGAHHCRHLQAAWNKYGAADFEFRPLVFCDRWNVVLYEQIAFDAFAPEYNVLRVAGSSLGRRATPETRAKIKAKAIGRKRSPESLAKYSQTVKGRKLAPEHVAHLFGNKHAVGLRHTEEWKAANSARNIGVKRPKDAEYRAKIAAALLGRKATPEARANQSAAQRGKKRGPYKRPPEPTA
jgi:group I intron endonuclease